jgi:hypothetical protein
MLGRPDERGYFLIGSASEQSLATNLAERRRRRVVKVTGDDMLVEPAIAVDAGLRLAEFAE